MAIVARASAEGLTFGRKNAYNGAQFFPFRRGKQEAAPPCVAAGPQGGRVCASDREEEKKSGAWKCVFGS